MKLRYETLEIWQLAMKLLKFWQKIQKKFPPEEKYKLTDQLDRAIMGISSQIAEGSAKGNKEFAHYLDISKGSLLEAKNHFTISSDRQYVTKEEFKNLDSLIKEQYFKQIAFQKSLLKSNSSKVAFRPIKQLKQSRQNVGRSRNSSNSSNSRNSLGFTLIELLVATSILGIITGGGVASYVSFNQREKLKAAALAIKTSLREAQVQALAGVKSDICGEEKLLDGWCVDLFRKKMYGHCGGADPASENFNFKDLEMPEGVTLSFYSSQGTQDIQRAILRFKPLAQGVDKDSIICVLGFGKKYKLSVSTSGEITDFGFVQNCP